MNEIRKKIGARENPTGATIGGGGQDPGIARRVVVKEVLRGKEVEDEPEMGIEEIVEDEIGNETEIEIGRGRGIGTEIGKEIEIATGGYEMIAGIGTVREEVLLHP